MSRNIQMCVYHCLEPKDGPWTTLAGQSTAQEREIKVSEHEVHGMM